MNEVVKVVVVMEAAGGGCKQLACSSLPAEGRSAVTTPCSLSVTPSSPSLPRPTATTSVLGGGDGGTPKSTAPSGDRSGCLPLLPLPPGDAGGVGAADAPSLPPPPPPWPRRAWLEAGTRMVLRPCSACADGSLLYRSSALGCTPYRTARP